MNHPTKIPLSDVCQINMGQSPVSSSYNQSEMGIPFYQGNADFGRLHPKTRFWCSKPKKIAQRDDILISVRAPIGAMNIANETCCIGRGLAAITANEEKADAKFLFYFLTSKNVELNAKGTGSTFKAVSKKTISETLMPNIPIAKQRSMVSILENAEELIYLRTQQLSKLDQLVKSKFVEMFGEPVKNIMGWKTLPLEQLGELNRGVSKHRPRNDSFLLGGEYPLVQTGDVSNSSMYIVSYKNSYSEAGLKQSKMWPSGTLCITIAANIAKTAILCFDSCFPDSVVGFLPNSKTNQIFIHFWFSFFQEIIEKQAPAVAQKNINLRILKELQVITPPFELQDQFSSFVTQVETQKKLVKQSLDLLELNKKSLMQQYFGA